MLDFGFYNRIEHSTEFMFQAEPVCFLCGIRQVLGDKIKG
jgi:hypothetical protein